MGKSRSSQKLNRSTMFSDWCHCLLSSNFFSRFLRIGNSCEYYFRLSIFISFSLYFTFALYIFCFLLVEEPTHWSQISSQISVVSQISDLQRFLHCKRIKLQICYILIHWIYNSISPLWQSCNVNCIFFCCLTKERYFTTMKRTLKYFTQLLTVKLSKAKTA